MDLTPEERANDTARAIAAVGLSFMGPLGGGLSTFLQLTWPEARRERAEKLLTELEARVVSVEEFNQQLRDNPTFQELFSKALQSAVDFSSDERIRYIASVLKGARDPRGAYETISPLLNILDELSDLEVLELDNLGFRSCSGVGDRYPRDDLIFAMPRNINQPMEMGSSWSAKKLRLKHLESVGLIEEEVDTEFAGFGDPPRRKRRPDIPRYSLTYSGEQLLSLIKCGNLTTSVERQWYGD